MPEIIIISLSGNQTVTLNAAKVQKPMPLSKLAKLLIIFLICRFVQQFPPIVDGLVIREARVTQVGNLSARSERDVLFNGVTSKRKHKGDRKPELPAETLDFIFPNGTKLSAAG